MNQQTYLRTSQLCALAGIDRETLRFYEAQQLIPPPRRSLNGYREYPPESVLRLQFVSLGKQAGFTLAEIALLLNRPEGTDPAQLRQAVAQQVARLDTRITELQAMRQLLTSLLAQPLDTTDMTNCPILRFLQNKKEIS